MSKRRTAEDAFNMPDAVKDFIDRGVQERQNPIPDAGQSVGRDPLVESLTLKRKVVEFTEGRALTTESPSQPTRDGTRQSPALDLTRTYAKATIQKTVRFHPKLIAELEAHVRRQELADEKPIPFQQVQNEALDLWLERYVRNSGRR